MREFEMRQRAESLIRRGMQGMISPGLALSLALAGCGGSDYMAQMPRHDAGPYHDGGGVLSDTPLYAAPIPDSGRPEFGAHESGIDVAPGLDVDIDGPVIDASNESASRDSDESARG